MDNWLQRCRPRLPALILLCCLVNPPGASADTGTPVAADDPDAAITVEDTPVVTIDVLANDTLLDNAVITGFDALSANGGTVVSNGDGTFTYTPAAGFNGPDSFTYTLTDDDAETDTATAFVIVTPVNNGPPVATDDPLAAATASDTAVNTRNVLSNDTLTDHAVIDSFDDTSANGGAVASNGDGTFTYMPASGFSGLDTFTYTLRDDEAETATATATIIVSDLPRGFLDVTLLPGVDPTGRTDSTQGLQSAVNLARDFGLVSFFPVGTYRVSDTLDLAQNTRFSNDGTEGGRRSQSCVLVGSSLGAMPRIVLQDNSAGFDDPDNPKAVLYFRLNYQVVNESQAGVPNTFANNGETRQFGQGLRGLDIVTGANPGAIGIHMAAAQESFMEDIRVDASGGLAGISGVPGRGMAAVNIEIVGGRFGFRILSGSLGASLVGITLSNQSETAIVWQAGVGLSVTGFRIDRTPGAGPAITTTGGDYRNGNFLLTHGSIDMNGGGLAVDNSAGNFVYMRNLWISGGADVVQSANNPVVPSAGGAWTRVEEYSYTRTDGARPHFNLIDGQLNQDELIVTSASTAPPSDLVSRHVWTALPRFEDPGVVNVLEAGAIGDGVRDDTDALQQAIDSHPRVFLPMGRYAISRPLRLHADTRLFGVPGSERSEIVRAAGWNPVQPGWMIETDDVADGTAYLGELLLNQELSPFLGGVHWRLGQDSMLHNVWARRIDESENVQMFRVSGNGGGRWYRFAYAAKQEHTAVPNSAFRPLLIDATTQPLSLYGFNSEHGQVEPYIDIRSAQNVFAWGGKTEITDGNFMQINGSRNVWVSQLGRHSVDPGQATFRVAGNTDTQITGVWPNDDGTLPDARYSVLESDTGLSISGEASIGVYRRGSINDLSTPATISIPPVDQTVPLGDSATFSVTAIGEPPLAYQWQRNGGDIAGATGNVHTTPATTASDDGTVFTVVVSNASTSVTSAPATLSVTLPVTITVQPQSQSVNHLEPATFTVSATGSPPLAYQWRRDAVDIPGATGASYTIPQTVAEDTGSSFSVTVSNSLGSITSAAALLTVGVPPDTPPTLVAQPSDLTVTEGDNATFSVSTSGSLPLAYQWQRNGADIPGATASAYTVPAATLLDSGATFRVRISNASGSVVTNAATLQVDSAASPRVSSGLQAMYSFEEGGGSLVRDVSGVGTALDLSIADPAATTWLPGRLQIDTATTIASAAPASKIINAAQASNALTLEAWVTPANTTQSGPARIVTLSENLQMRNITLGQDGSGYNVRLRTTATDDNGNPALNSPVGSLTATPTHVAYTRDAAGTARLYIDGLEQSSAVIAGDLSTWNATYLFGLGDELSGGRPWLGQFDLVAVYDRALSPAEITQNQVAGPVINHAPVAVADPFTVTEGSSLNPLDVLANDSDPDSTDTLILTGVGIPDQGGSALINAGGDALLYTPAGGFSGTESFGYTVSDGGLTGSATVTVTVTNANSGPPLAVDDPDAAITAENTPVITGNVLANDTLVDNAAVKTYDDPSANDGSVVYNGNGTFSYTPASYFHGSDSFTYTLSDDELETSTATVTLTVSPVNNGPPVAVDDPDAATTAQNQPAVTVDVTANDTLVDNAAIGVFDAGSNNGGAVAYNGNGTFSYTPPTDFTGSDSFTYTLNDDDGENSAPAIVTVTVTDPAATADGDLAPRGAIDGELNVADLLIMQRIVLGEITPTALELLHGDLDGNGEISLADLVLQQAMILGAAGP